MRILFLSDNFPPEGNAPASRLYEHSVRWARAGHEVTVITSAPNFPEGKLFKGYRNRWHHVEQVDGIRVVRVKTYIAPNEGFGRRILDYLSFMVSSFLAGLVEKRPDVIVGTSPQFFTVCSAWMLSVFRRRPFVFELRDLWPASITAVGTIRRTGIIRALERLEAFLYRKADAIVSVTHAFKAELKDRGVDPDKIAVVTNGVDLEKYRPRERDEALAEQYGIGDKFVVGYIGTHGLAQALGSVLDAAFQLQDEENIAYLFAGSGAEREKLIAKAGQLDLANVRFVPRQPKESMPALWSLCDLSLIHLKDDDLFRTVIPSKLFESMGMGLPVLMAVPDGEATGIVRETGCGVTVAPEDPMALARRIVALRDDPEQLRRFAKASADAARRYSREAQAGRMLAVLTAVSEGRGEQVGRPAFQGPENV